MRLLMKNLLLSLFLIMVWNSLNAQYTIITPGNAQPNINTNSPNSQGVIIPNLTTIQRDQIQGPERGAVIYNTSCSCLNYYNGFQWIKLTENIYSDEYAPPRPIIGNTLGRDYFYASGADEANAIALVTPGSNTSEYYVTGRAWFLTPLSQANKDGYFIARFGANSWERKVTDAIGYDVAIDNDGNVYTTGTFTGTVDFGTGNTLTSQGDTDIFLAKYDSNGNILWVRNAGGNGSDLGRALAINGSVVYLTGYFSNTNFTIQSPANNISLTSAGGKDIFIASYDINGNLIWAQRAGGVADDEAKDINKYSGVVGYFTGTASFGTKIHTSNGGKDLFLAYCDANGNIVKSLSAGGTGDDVVNGINNDYLITGYFSNNLSMPTVNSGTLNVRSSGGKDMFLAHSIGDYNDYSKLVARVLVRGGGINDDEGVKVTMSGSSNFALIAVAGNFSGNADFGGPFLVTNTQSGFIATFSWDGFYQWGKSLSKTVTSFVSDIGITSASKPYIVGIYGTYQWVNRPYPSTMRIWTTE